MTSIHKRVRRIEADMELLPTITSFDDWETLMLRDKKILSALHKYGVKGTSTTQLAKDIGLNKPAVSGRTIILRRLRRIQKVSLQLKGAPLVVHVGKNWSLNFEDFKFDIQKEGDMEENQ